MFEKLPNQTQEIFEWLSKGKFISSNSTSEKQAGLYDIITAPENFELLQEYFMKIGFVLSQENDYVYFSRQESNAELERKLQQAAKWIDYLDFFKSYDNNFSFGSTFTIARLEQMVKVDVNLQSKLETMRFDEGSYHSRILKLVTTMQSDGFFELQDELQDIWKVLASFQYLVKLISHINITEEAKDEASK